MFRFPGVEREDDVFSSCLARAVCCVLSIFFNSWDAVVVNGGGVGLGGEPGHG